MRSCFHRLNLNYENATQCVIPTEYFQAISKQAKQCSTMTNFYSRERNNNNIVLKTQLTIVSKTKSKILLESQCFERQDRGGSYFARQLDLCSLFSAKWHWNGFCIISRVKKYKYHANSLKNFSKKLDQISLRSALIFKRMIFISFSIIQNASLYSPIKFYNSFLFSTDCQFFCTIN